MLSLVWILIPAFVGLGSTYNKDDCYSFLKRDKYLQVFGNSCFHFYPYTRKDYHNAKDVCEAAGGYLAMPKTQALNDFLTKQLRSYYGVHQDTWIGLTDEDTEGKFMWDDGTPLRWEHFANNNGPKSTYFIKPSFEDCATLRPSDGTWHDYHCDNEIFGIFNEEKPFVCQYPITTTTPKTTLKTTTTTAHAPTGTTPCPSVTCDLDCGMNGFKLSPKTGCFLCECDD